MNSLVSYSGSSSEDEENKIEQNCPLSTPTVAMKRTQDQDKAGDQHCDLKKRCTAENHEDREARKCSSQVSANGLPLPGAIMNMFEDKAKQRKDISENPSQHGGRVRSFPHLEGNWASYLYIPVSPDERYNTLIDMLLMCLRPQNFERMDDLHVSLSRTVAIRHHWIQPLTDSLKETFLQMDSCLCDVGAIKMYTNDEKTRTFVSVEIKAEDTNLLEYVSAVDAAFTEFNLPKFYENPSFHFSLVWCVGDVISKIPEKTKEEIQRLTSEFFCTHTELSVVPVHQVRLKTGNKTFAFHLHNAID